jgi:hypothetical protein
VGERSMQARGCLLSVRAADHGLTPLTPDLLTLSWIGGASLLNNAACRASTRPFRFLRSSMPRPHRHSTRSSGSQTQFPKRINTDSNGEETNVAIKTSIIRTLPCMR